MEVGQGLNVGCSAKGKNTVRVAFVIYTRLKTKLAASSKEACQKQMKPGNSYVATQLWEDWVAHLSGSSVSRVALQFPQLCSAQSDNISRKSRLRCGCQFFLVCLSP
jgi:hypothetical protein